MKNLLVIVAVLWSLHLSAQNGLWFDTAKIDTHTKLIGRYPHYDKQKTFSSWNFCIEKPAEIKKVLVELSLGKEGANEVEDPCFMLTIIQDNKEVTSCIVNPTLNSLMSNGRTYKFNIKKLQQLAQKYPFDYRFEKVTFKNQKEYDSYVARQKVNNNFLFDYSPLFKYEGVFNIQFPRNETFSSPNAISDYLKPRIEKIVAKDTYRVAYFLDDKNTQDQSQFTMMIAGSKKLFDQLQVGNLKKENWQPEAEEGWFFYKIK